MDDYEALVRELAEGRNLQRQPLTNAELTTVVRKHPDVLGEGLMSLGDQVDLFVDAMKTNSMLMLAAYFKKAIRERCEAYLEPDIGPMREQIESEIEDDDRYTRRAI